jgi:hypothetical protein
MSDIVDAVRMGDLRATQGSVKANLIARHKLTDDVEDLVVALATSPLVTSRVAPALVAAVWPTFVLGLWPDSGDEPPSSAGADTQLVNVLRAVAKALNHVDKSGVMAGPGYDALVRAIAPYLRNHFIYKLAKVDTPPALATRLFGLMPDVTPADVAQRVIASAMLHHLDDLDSWQVKLEQLTPMLRKADVPALLATLYREHRRYASARTLPKDAEALRELNIKMRVLERQLKKELLPEALAEMEDRRGGSSTGLLEASTKFAAARRRNVMRAKDTHLRLRTRAAAARAWPNYEGFVYDDDSDDDDESEAQAGAGTGAGVGAADPDAME